MCFKAVGALRFQRDSYIQQAKSGLLRLMKASFRCLFAHQRVSSIWTVRSCFSLQLWKQFFLAWGLLAFLLRFSCDGYLTFFMKLVTSSSLVTMATISSFICLQTLWNFVRISMLLVSSWTRLKTRCRMRSKTVQCLMRSAYLPQLRWSMASALLLRSAQKRSISPQSRQSLKMASFSLMKISSKFLMERMCGVVELLTFRRFLFSAEMIFLVKVSFLPCELRQYFFLLICSSELLISFSMQPKLSSSFGEFTFSVVAMKWSMMSLLRLILYLARSYFLNQLRICSAQESVSCFSMSFILWKIEESSVFVSWRASSDSHTLRSARLSLAMSRGLSVDLGRIMDGWNNIVFYGRGNEQRSKKKREVTANNR